MLLLTGGGVLWAGSQKGDGPLGGSDMAADFLQKSAERLVRKLEQDTPPFTEEEVLLIIKHCGRERAIHEKASATFDFTELNKYFELMAQDGLDQNRFRWGRSILLSIYSARTTKSGLELLVNPTEEVQFILDLMNPGLVVIHGPAFFEACYNSPRAANP